MTAAYTATAGIGEALIPTHTKIQFAGNMGLLSFGTGWDYGRRNQWETDVFFGIAQI